MRLLKKMVTVVLIVVAVSAFAPALSIAATPLVPAGSSSNNTAAQVAALQAQVAVLQAKFTNLSSVTAASMAWIAALQNSDTAQNTNINALKAKDTTQDANIAGLQSTDTAQNGNISGLQTNVLAIQNSSVYALKDYLTVDTSTTIENQTGLKGPHIIFTGANVHIRSGAGSTDEGKWNNPDIVLTGLGNLIIGYNEGRDDFGHPYLLDRGGSHNLIVGRSHRYTSFGGFAAGFNNEISGAWSSISGGGGNIASGEMSSVSGGGPNRASGRGSSVSGGRSNIAAKEASSISGGGFNTADGEYSSVCGGAGITNSDYFGWSAGGMNPTSDNGWPPYTAPYSGVYHTP